MKLIQIDSDIPIPAIRGRGKRTGYPFATMKVGDSFFTEDTAHRAGNNVRYYSLKNPFRFTTRTVTEKGVKGTRVWRIK